MRAFLERAGLTVSWFEIACSAWCIYHLQWWLSLCVCVLVFVVCVFVKGGGTRPSQYNSCDWNKGQGKLTRHQFPSNNELNAHIIKYKNCAYDCCQCLLSLRETTKDFYGLNSHSCRRVMSVWSLLGLNMCFYRADFEKLWIPHRVLQVKQHHSKSPVIDNIWASCFLFCKNHKAAEFD